MCDDCISQIDVLWSHSISRSHGISRIVYHTHQVLGTDQWWYEEWLWGALKTLMPWQGSHMHAGFLNVYANECMPKGAQNNPFFWLADMRLGQNACLVTSKGQACSERCGHCLVRGFWWAQEHVGQVFWNFLARLLIRHSKEGTKKLMGSFSCCTAATQAVSQGTGLTSIALIWKKSGFHDCWSFSHQIQAWLAYAHYKGFTFSMILPRSWPSSWAQLTSLLPATRSVFPPTGWTLAQSWHPVLPQDNKRCGEL